MYHIPGIMLGLTILGVALYASASLRPPKADQCRLLTEIANESASTHRAIVIQTMADLRCPFR